MLSLLFSCSIFIANLVLCSLMVLLLVWDLKNFFEPPKTGLIWAALFVSEAIVCAILFNWQMVLFYIALTALMVVNQLISNKIQDEKRD